MTACERLDVWIDAHFNEQVRFLQAVDVALAGQPELHFTYDEEFGGELGPGCLQMEVTLQGLASHAAYPETGIDALQAATKLLAALHKVRLYGEHGVPAVICGAGPRTLYDLQRPSSVQGN